MVKNYLSAFSNLQLQARLPGALQHHCCFAARSRANVFCHSRLQIRLAGASHRIDPATLTMESPLETSRARSFSLDKKCLQRSDEYVQVVQMFCAPPFSGGKTPLGSRHSLGCALSYWLFASRLEFPVLCPDFILSPSPP